MPVDNQPESGYRCEMTESELNSVWRSALDDAVLPLLSGPSTLVEEPAIFTDELAGFLPKNHTSSNIHFSAVILASLIGASLVDAAAIPSQKPIQATLVRKNESASRAALALGGLKRQFRKHGVDRFAGGRAFNLTERAASSPLTDDQDYVYYVTTTFGNGQTFSMDLDTGSSDTWVRGASCTSSDGSCTGSKLSTSDSTLTSAGASFSTSYGSGSVSGKIYKGPVAIGGAKASSLYFGVSTKETGFSGNDGLIGLGYKSLSQIASSVSGQTNFFDALGFTGANNVFAFYLSNAADGDFGEVTFGGVDTTKYSGTIKYAPLTSQTYWEFSFSGSTFTVGSSTGNLYKSYPSAIADTGTSLVILETSVANAINKAIGATYSSSDGVYLVSCSASLPSVKFTVAGSTYTFAPSEYLFNDSGTCFTGFTQGASSFGLSILGDVFLRKAYSVYDKNSNRVGFAPAVHA
ncbi:aspartic peptidase domain-containing protein [Cladochytrium replicatum]|nr:aspartic peptidase domain-containing protein [Cladochytrium replicatum]